MLLTTQVTNNSKKGLDLTCGGPVQIRVYNDKEQEYSPVDDLYQIKGNPECNSRLDPGFSASMTWAFLVPSTSKMIAASFYNINDLATVTREPTFIALAEHHLRAADEAREAVREGVWLHLSDSEAYTRTAGVRTRRSSMMP